MAIFYDILLDADGDLPRVTRHVRSWLTVVQRVQFRLSTFQGEWILDTDEGLPFITWRSQKKPNLGELGARVQRDILATPGVVRLISFSGKFFEDEQRIQFDIALEVEDAEDTTQVVPLAFFPFGDSRANTNPIALYTAPSKTVL